MITLQNNKNQIEYQAQKFPDEWKIPPASNLTKTINNFPSIDLCEMDSVALLSRFDTKYILSTVQLYQALQKIKFSYRILEINKKRIHHYQTLYYDTTSFDLYYGHVTHRADVFKVRSREYKDTELSYLEVKHKNRKQWTEKSRIRIPHQTGCLSNVFDSFLEVHNPFSSRDLKPKLWNVFKRITLVDNRNSERLTIDIDLRFFNEINELSLDGIVVAEVKQNQKSTVSVFKDQMRHQGIRPLGFSKYCFGVSQFYSDVKKNTQKRKMLLINKLQQG